MGSIAQLRQLKFYLQPEWIFRLTEYWTDQRKSLKILHDFTDQVLNVLMADYGIIALLTIFPT